MGVPRVLLTTLTLIRMLLRRWRGVRLLRELGQTGVPRQVPRLREDLFRSERRRSPSARRRLLDARRLGRRRDAGLLGDAVAQIGRLGQEVALRADGEVVGRNVALDATQAERLTAEGDRRVLTA